MLRLGSALGMVAASLDDGSSGRWKINMEVGTFKRLNRMQLQRLPLPLLSLCVLLLVTAGCGTVYHMQYRVTPGGAARMSAPTQASVGLSDRVAVEELLKQTAQRLHLEERPSASLVPNTIAYYLAPDTSTPIKLLAWSHLDRIIIDFMHTPGTLGEDAVYRSARESLWAALRAKFGSRAQIVPTRQHISPHH